MYRAVDGWMNFSQAAELLLVDDTSIGRKIEKLGLLAEVESFGAHERRVSPTAVLTLAGVFKKVPLTEVGGGLVNHAEANASPERARAIDAEVQAFIDAVPDEPTDTVELSAAHDRFLARARKLVSDDVYRELERAYRATHALARSAR